MIIGKNTYIHPTAQIANGVQIGDNCYIGAFCVIGFPPEHSQISVYDDCGSVVIGNGCTLYKLVTVDASINPNENTVISDNCKLYAHSHVGHDSYIDNKCIISTGAKIGGHSFVGQHSTIGLNATLHQHALISWGTMVGANAFVKGKHTEAFRIIAGVPAKDIGENTVGLERFNKK